MWRYSIVAVIVLTCTPSFSFSATVGGRESPNGLRRFPDDISSFGCLSRHRGEMCRVSATRNQTFSMKAQRKQELSETKKERLSIPTLADYFTNECAMNREYCRTTRRSYYIALVPARAERQTDLPHMIHFSDINPPGRLCKKICRAHATCCQGRIERERGKERHSSSSPLSFFLKDDRRTAGDERG